MSEVNESELGLTFAKPALADHLMRRDPDAELVLFRIEQLLVGRLRLPFAFPEKPDEVTLVPVASHPSNMSLTLMVSTEPPVRFKAGPSLSEPETELQETVPVALTGGAPAEAVPTRSTRLPLLLATRVSEQ